jgi:hypothetical protein
VEIEKNMGKPWKFQACLLCPDDKAEIKEKIISSTSSRVSTEKSWKNAEFIGHLSLIYAFPSEHNKRAREFRWVVDGNRIILKDLEIIGPPLMESSQPAYYAFKRTVIIKYFW